MCTVHKPEHCKYCGAFFAPAKTLIILPYTLCTVLNTTSTTIDPVQPVKYYHHNSISCLLPWALCISWNTVSTALLSLHLPKLYLHCNVPCTQITARPVIPCIMYTNTPELWWTLYIRQTLTLLLRAMQHHSQDWQSSPLFCTLTWTWSLLPWVLDISHSATSTVVFSGHRSTASNIVRSVHQTEHYQYYHDLVTLNLTYTTFPSVMFRSYSTASATLYCSEQIDHLQNYPVIWTGATTRQVLLQILYNIQAKQASPWTLYTSWSITNATLPYVHQTEHH